MTEMKYKDNSQPLEVPDSKGYVEGYASVYGVVDSQKEVVDRGAFQKALADPKKLKFLWQHDYKKPIGRIVKLWEDDYGLKYQARYNLKTSWGKDAYEAAVNQDIDGNSIGYTMHNGKAFKDDEGVNHLQDVGLMEISNVTFPSNTEAVNTDVKSMEIKGALPYHKTPLAPEGQAWDGPAQVAAADVEALKEMCACVRGDPTNKTSYALPHHMASGDHACVWNGVVGCYGALQGSRTGSEMSGCDGAEAHILKHYADFGKTPPGKEDGNTMETKAGRVLSTKNEADLSKANDLLDQAGDLIEGVLTQVTGTDYNEPGEKPTTASVEPGKSDNDELIRLKLTELNKLLRK
jgi:HK97 family phage prohead protease